MNGREERQALVDLRWLRQMVEKLSDRVILNALARDGEYVPGTDGTFESLRDPVHESVVKMCSHLRDAANHVEWAVGTLTVLTQGEPTGEHEQSVPDCLACGDLALPRPKSGFCQPCYASWRRFSASRRGDRLDFIRWRQETLNTATEDSDAG